MSRPVIFGFHPEWPDFSFTDLRDPLLEGKVETLRGGKEPNTEEEVRKVPVSGDRLVTEKTKIPCHTNLTQLGLLSVIREVKFQDWLL